MPRPGEKILHSQSLGRNVGWMSANFENSKVEKAADFISKIDLAALH